LNEKIFEFYIKMTDPEIKDLEADKEVKFKNIKI
jgi:hypothetical protein